MKYHTIRVVGWRVNSRQARLQISQAYQRQVKEFAGCAWRKRHRQTCRPFVRDFLNCHSCMPLRYTFSLLAKCPGRHYNNLNQTNCDRGKRRWLGASREPVAGVNRRPGPFASAFRASGDESEGRAPYSARQVGLYISTGKPGGTAEALRPRHTGQEGFLYSQSFQGGRSNHAGHQSDSYKP